MLFMILNVRIKLKIRCCFANIQSSHWPLIITFACSNSQDRGESSLYSLKGLKRLSIYRDYCNTANQNKQNTQSKVTD